MANRFELPIAQGGIDAAGLPYAGGFLFFYASGTSTPLTTYSDSGLSIPNSNPVVLDSAGRYPDIFLQNLAYKVVLEDVNANQIWAADPVYTSDFSTIAQFATYAGNPNGHVAGTAGSGSVPSSVIWDSVDDLLFVATTTGNASTTVWTQVAQNFSGAVTFNSFITPGALGSDTNNWAPTGFNSAYLVRASSSTNIQLTGLAGGAGGRDILLTNIGTSNITLVGNSLSSSAGNRFLLDRPVVLSPTEAIALSYDATSSGWRNKSPYTSNPVAAGFKNLKITVTSNTVTTLTADAMTLEDSSGNVYRTYNPSLSMDISTSGANGLDTGVVANQTFYAVWGIFNPATNVTAGLYSTSSTLAGLILPTGYTFAARFGWVITDSSAHILRTLQYGRIVTYVIGTTNNPTFTPTIATGTAGTFSNTSPVLTAVTVSAASGANAFVPPTASRIHVAASATWKGGGSGQVLVASNTAWGGTNRGVNGSVGNIWQFGLSSGSSSDIGGNTQGNTWITLENTTIAWAGNAAGIAIGCLGWEDNI